MKESGIAQAISLADIKARYDNCAKKLLSYNVIAAWILKYCTKEFSGYDVSFIANRCINGEPEISTRAVHQDHIDGDKRIEELNSESGSIGEGTVYFDIRFNASVPEDDKLIQLIINLEIQLKDNPGYPLVKRGFYYCARMISKQYGTVFTDERYGDIRKVYSIWICPDTANKRANGILRYSIGEDVILGNSTVTNEDYDLMNVVIVNLGKKAYESNNVLINLLGILLSSEMSAKEKKEALSGNYQIPMTSELESEVQIMCNLSDSLVQQGFAQGIKQGEIKERNKFIIKLLKSGAEDDYIISMTDCSEEELQAAKRSLKSMQEMNIF